MIITAAEQHYRLSILSRRIPPAAYQKQPKKLMRARAIRTSGSVRGAYDSAKAAAPSAEVVADAAAVAVAAVAIATAAVPAAATNAAQLLMLLGCWCRAAGTAHQLALLALVLLSG